MTKYKQSIEVLTLQVVGTVAEFERGRIRKCIMDNMFHAANQREITLTKPIQLST